MYGRIDSSISQLAQGIISTYRSGRLRRVCLLRLLLPLDSMREEGLRNKKFNNFVQAAAVSAWPSLLSCWPGA